MVDSFLRGVITSNSYTTCLRRKLLTYDIADFDINAGKSSGIVNLGDDGHVLGYSKWVSPKRTRSYPFSRIYDTYHLPKKVTVIPVMKDEGLNGDNDRVNFITLSWMNLLNVYVILAWYDAARANPRRSGKITSQKFDPDYVREKMIEIGDYHQTALHWNTMHFDRDFEWIYRQAVASYQRISTKTNIPLRPAAMHLAILEQFLVDGRFDRAAFKSASLPRSRAAAERELLTDHINERLGDGDKRYFSITNWLGGEYFLTADEVFAADEQIVIQESKHTTGSKFPSLGNIKDGLFKLILFANMDELTVAGSKVEFDVCLKLTGRFSGLLRLPTDAATIAEFTRTNMLKSRAVKLLEQLNTEAATNKKLSIIISEE